MRTFSSSVQRRRRPVSVTERISTSGLYLWSDIAPDLRREPQVRKTVLPGALHYKLLVDEETWGAYLQEELTFDDRWILTLGLRYDEIKANSVQD